MVVKLGTHECILIDLMNFLTGFEKHTEETPNRCSPPAKAPGYVYMCAFHILFSTPTHPLHTGSVHTMEADTAQAERLTICTRLQERHYHTPTRTVQARQTEQTAIVDDFFFTVLIKRCLLTCK